MTNETKLAAAIFALSASVTAGAIALSASEDVGKVAVRDDAGVRSDFCVHTCTDLLTAPVEPGATITTGVNLPRDAKLDHAGPGAVFGGPGFEVVAATLHAPDQNHAWLEVRVKNLGGVPMRFIGFVSYTLQETK